MLPLLLPLCDCSPCRRCAAALCQRNCHELFAFLHGRRAALTARSLEAFYARAIAGKFGDSDCAPPPPRSSRSWGLTGAVVVVYDVYIARGGRVKLLDFGPFGGDTDPLLYTWAELRELASALTPAIRPVVGRSACTCARGGGGD